MCGPLFTAHSGLLNTYHLIRVADILNTVAVPTTLIHYKCSTHPDCLTLTACGSTYHSFTKNARA